MEYHRWTWDTPYAVCSICGQDERSASVRCPGLGAAPLHTPLSKCVEPVASLGSYRMTVDVVTHSSQAMIVQRIETTMDGLCKTLSMHVMDTREASVRDALIRLGWTPPKEDAT